MHIVQKMNNTVVHRLWNTILLIYYNCVSLYVHCTLYSSIHNVCVIICHRVHRAQTTIFVGHSETICIQTMLLSVRKLGTCSIVFYTYKCIIVKYMYNKLFCYFEFEGEQEKVKDNKKFKIFCFIKRFIKIK